MPNKFGDISSNIDILDGQVLRSKTDGTGFESYDIESALNNKADQSTTYTKTETDNLLDNKLEAGDIVNFETTTELNARDTANRNRANHTGTQTASTISDFQSSVSANADVSANTSARHTHGNKALLDTYTQTESDLEDAVTKKHTHSNKTILDNTTASFTTSDETKLDGIEAGAEVNTLNDIIAGANIAIDKTDPLNPIINATGGGGLATVLDDLTDVTITTPANGQALTYNGTQWVNSTPAGGGDMLKSVYDTNDDGIVNQADVITNQGDLATLDSVDTAQITNGAVENTKLADMNANTVKGRLSGNGAPQDVAMADLPMSTATQTALNGKQNILSEGAFVNGDKTKLDGIEAGAEINEVNEAPTDGEQYARKNGAWEVVVGGDPLAVVSDVTGVTGADRVTNIISLTKAEYNAITPDTSTIYNITDDAVEYEGKVGTKVVDETSIGDDKILVYKTASGKLEYETKPTGGGGLITDIVQFTRDLTTASGTINISHSLGVAPTSIKIVGMFNNGDYTGITNCDGAYDGTNNMCTYRGGQDGTIVIGNNSAKCIDIHNANPNQVFSDANVSAVSSTNFTLNWTRINSKVGTAYFTAILYA